MFKIVHDLSTLSEEQKKQYLYDYSEFLGLNPLENRLDMFWMNSDTIRSLVAYCRRGTTDLLRDIHGIDVIELVKEDGPGYVSFTATGRNRKGRTEMAVGAYSTTNLTGDRLAAAIAIAQTRALRRLTLQFVGGGLSDESEVNREPVQSVSHQLEAPPVFAPSVFYPAPSQIPFQDNVPFGNIPYSPVNPNVPFGNIPYNPGNLPVPGDNTGILRPTYVTISGLADQLEVSEPDDWETSQPLTVGGISPVSSGLQQNPSKEGDSLHKVEEPAKETIKTKRKYTRKSKNTVDMGDKDLGQPDDSQIDYETDFYKDFDILGPPNVLANPRPGSMLAEDVAFIKFSTNAEVGVFTEKSPNADIPESQRTDTLVLTTEEKETILRARSFEVYRAKLLESTVSRDISDATDNITKSAITSVNELLAPSETFSESNPTTAAPTMTDEEKKLVNSKLSPFWVQILPQGGMTASPGMSISAKLKMFADVYDPDFPDKTKWKVDKWLEFVDYINDYNTTEGAKALVEYINQKIAKCS